MVPACDCAPQTRKAWRLCHLCHPPSQKCTSVQKLWYLRHLVPLLATKVLSPATKVLQIRRQTGVLGMSLCDSRVTVLTCMTNVAVYF
eukprot:g12407.t1